jgi:glutathione S-transferase
MQMTPNDLKPLSFDRIAEFAPRKREQHFEAYRAINPRRLVPTLGLVDGSAIGDAHR